MVDHDQFGKGEATIGNQFFKKELTEKIFKVL